ncbi:hypothetical protein GXW82_16690 [Streptacidiphilus sp. 4-A2]|nr:hypothetical protein [Streptacidiphilus sp. 4-A2]
MPALAEPFLGTALSPSLFDVTALLRAQSKAAAKSPARRGTAPNRPPDWWPRCARPSGPMSGPAAAPAPPCRTSPASRPHPAATARRR